MDQFTILNPESRCGAGTCPVESVDLRSTAGGQLDARAAGLSVAPRARGGWTRSAKVQGRTGIRRPRSRLGPLGRTLQRAVGGPLAGCQRPRCPIVTGGLQEALRGVEGIACVFAGLFAVFLRVK
ncbi:hypothetical protein HDV62DRAFT_252941 [Trichoderma sp. SZMC 28011]